MHWDQDEENAFPARHPREPGGLRQDILDEIADHLACAAAAEKERSGETNETTLWQRVRERFGDPDVLARRLWWDSMRETIMREWIQTGVLAVLAVAGIAGVVFMGLMLRQFGATNEAVLAALSQQQAGEARWATLELEFRRGSADGPLAEGVEVTINGRMFEQDSDSEISYTSDNQGRVSFGPTSPRTYFLSIVDPVSGLVNFRNLVLFPLPKSGEQIIVVPDVEPRPVRIDLDVPEGTNTEEQRIALNLHSTWEHDGETWIGSQECILDTGGGASAQESLVQKHTWFGSNPIRLTLEDVEKFRYPILLSGMPGPDCRIALTRKGENGFVGSPLNVTLDVNDDGSLLSVTTTGELANELQDWALYDQMTAQGLSVTKQLASAIRRAFPERTVTATVPVPESTCGLVGPWGYFASEVDRSQVFEILYTANRDLVNFDIDGEKAAVKRFFSPILQLPDAMVTMMNDGSQVVLAFYAEQGDLREFNNPLEVWPLYNDVFAMEWPTAEEAIGLYVEGSPNLQLGEEKVASIALETLGQGAWQFADVTEAARDGGKAPKGVLLKWKHDGEDYLNRLDVVSAEAKEIKREHLRPLWIVLEPKADAGGAS